MTFIEPLVYGELIAPERDFRRKILLPEEIPLHPKIFGADFTYTQKYVDEVVRSLPDSIAKDVSEIEKKLGTSIRIKATKAGIAYVDSKLGDSFVFGWVNARANPEMRYVDVVYGFANMAIDSREDRKIIKNLFTPHPMDNKKLEQYVVSYAGKYPQIIVWYVHNIQDTLITGLYFRNFAIMFNNIGLEKLE